ncbi:diguanylate cyclase domain-containing protein [Pseudanabaena sp. 'Roaring Creek']|uniref:diguanylate cyclase domain-containing protein n=1 Tax=Pseudanabaena sp. 'Roaring Creek' TaxID=1681830 RepID=UPI0006D7B98F|nr:diguanylate cyclase [Pseudanabaena sp. 'Roaring Creek']
MKGNRLFQKRTIRFVIFNLLVAIAYAMGVRLSHEFATLPATVASVWFPSGMTLALVYLLGNRAVLGIICGSTYALMLGLFKVNPSLPVWSFLLVLTFCACGNVLQPLVATYWIKRYARHQDIFSHVNTVVLYIAAAVFAPMVSASLGVTSLCVAGVIKWHGYGISWVTWWLGSALPHLIFTPTILLWKNLSQPNEHRWLEITLVLFVFLCVSWICFLKGYPLAYLLLPILIWTVFRYGSFFASLLVSLVSLIAILSTARGHGLYIENSPNQSLLLLQSFTAVFSLTSLILSAVIDERKEAELSLKQTMESLETQVIERTKELQQSKAQLSGFFASAPVGMGIVDRQLRYIRINPLLAEIYQRDLDECLGRSAQEIVPDLSLQIEASLNEVFKTGTPLLNQENASNLYNPDGTLQTWLSSYFPIFDLDDIPVAVGFVVFEISDRKRAEADMKYAESILRKANLELESLVNIDGLTQIANRRCFNQRLELEWSRLEREQQPLTLILFDIDYFKRYNDCYGHQMGDDCLMAIAQAVKQVLLRPTDLVARYGGEEFAVILPNTDAKGAIIVAEQIRRTITNLCIAHQKSDIGDIVTVSIGVASLIPNSIQEPSMLVKQADVALYHAKQRGRNQSVMFSPC